ncbi:hypothetical protein KVH15_33415 [Streptomyces olivaceus]|uniref:hypothetical protein n=1 Tax=Streptomyces olivaceus TaxID=47716 RepID=UPI001CCADDFF|nr:hypothetical protein [Streptomyces olivaceus]MBZ6085884.1 hypothetical protein [Streptomyces olivaceus]
MSNPMEDILSGIKRQLHDDDPGEFHGTEGGKNCDLCNPPPAKQVADAQRLVLSEALDLGTGAQWDVISMRVKELRRRADETAATETQAAVDLPTLAAALDGLDTLIATSSRDWGVYRVDAWIWAVICGWDCEQTEHDDTCVHGALEEMAQQHGWDDATVAKARRYRAAVRALTGPAAGARQDGAQR